MRRLTVAVLVFGSVVAAQKLPPKGTDMELAITYFREDEALR